MGWGEEMLLELSGSIRPPDAMWGGYLALVLVRTAAGGGPAAARLLDPFHHFVQVVHT